MIQFIMRTKIFSTAAVLVIAVFMISCQSSDSKSKKVATFDTNKIDAKKIKEDVVDIIVSMPSNLEVVNLINETGAAFIGGLTLEDAQINQLLTRAAKSKAYGSVLFDMAYANTYNQTNTFSKLLTVHESLTKSLGFEDLLRQQKKYQDRYQANKDNRDSINQIASEMLSSSNAYIQEHGSAVDISLVFAGATAKSLHVMSSVTLFARNNEKLVELMKSQKDRVNAAFRILELTSEDAEVNKMVEVIKPVNDVFSSSEPFTLDTVDKIQRLTEFVME